MKKTSPLVVEHLEGISRAAIKRYPDIITEFVRDISEKLSAIDYMRKAVPESYSLLRAIQMSVWAMKKPHVGR